MKYRFIFCLLLLFFGILLFAQNPWTLQACIDRAKTANIASRQKQIAAEQAKIAVANAKCQWLPSLSASASQSYELGISPTASGAYTHNNAWTTTFSASFSMPLFDGFLIHNNIKAAKLDLRAGIAERNQVQLEAVTNVIAGYLQILLDKELIKAAKDQVSLSEQQYKRTWLMIHAGELPKSELYEGTAQVAKDSASLVKTRGDLQLAIVDLAQQLQLKDISGFDIDSSGINAMPSYTLLPSSNIDSLYQLALQHYPAVQAAQYRINEGKSRIAIARSGFFPTINLDAGYSNGYYYYYNLPQGVSNSSFINQFHQNQQQILSLNLQIPIFNRLDVQHKVKTAKFDLQQQLLTLEDEKQQLFKMLQQIYYRAIADKAKYSSLQKETSALQVAYQYTLKKFEVGKISSFEVNEKQTALSQAISDQLEAKYDYLFSCLTINFYLGK